MNNQHAAITLASSLVALTSALKGEKHGVLSQVSAAAFALYLSPKQGEERIKTVYRKAGFVRKDKPNSLSEAGNQRIKAAIKIVEMRKESILNIIESSATNKTANDRLVELIIKDFLPSPTFPLQVHGKFMPMLLLGLSAQETRELLKGKKTAVEEQVEEEAEVMEGEASENDGNPEITPAPLPPTLEKELEACITRFYELTSKIKSGDIEALGRVENFANTITKSVMMLHNIHSLATPQGEAVEIVPFNEGLATNLALTLKSAVLTAPTRIKSKKRDKVRVSDVLATPSQIEALTQHFAA